MTVAQVLDIYGQDHAPNTADPARIGYAIDALLGWWKDRTVAAITGATCRRYARERGVAPATSRRELGTLRAALVYCRKEGYLLHAPDVVLPDKSEPKDRWLTRREVATMLWATRRLRIDGRHLNRFILAAVYTGTRRDAVLALRIDIPSPQAGHIDTETGILHRAGSAERRTKKRRGQAKVPRKLLGHVRRWKASGSHSVVQDNSGARIGSIKSGWRRMLVEAEKIAEAGGFEFDTSEVTPHTLRHTAITWAVQRGASMTDITSFFGVSMQTVERTYWHHSPMHQRSAVEAMDGR